MALGDLPGDLEIELDGEDLILLPERAVFWPRAGALLVADTHWGKTATWRAASVPVPEGSTEDDLARLGGALTRTGATQLIVLGDLLHAKTGRSPTAFASVTRWRKQYAAIEMILVRGNHDRRAGDPPDEWRFRCVEGPMLFAPFTFQHEPPESPENNPQYILAGHIHPGARLVGKGLQQAVLPCFWFGRQVGVLPAFGSFTGLATISPIAGDCVCVVADDQVFDVS